MQERARKSREVREPGNQRNERNKVLYIYKSMPNRNRTLKHQGRK